MSYFDAYRKKGIPIPREGEAEMVIAWVLVLHHLEDLDEMIRKIRRIRKGGISEGMFMAAVMSYQDITKILQNVQPDVRVFLESKYESRLCQDKEFLRKMMEKHDFRAP